MPIADDARVGTRPPMRGAADMGSEAGMLDGLDHVAIEVPDLDLYIDKFVATDGLKVVRRGTASVGGARIAMLGDQCGMKIELIENQDASGLRFLHVAFRSADVDAAARDCERNGWRLLRGPSDIAAAQARSAFLADDSGFEFQLLTYRATSSDVATG